MCSRTANSCMSLQMRQQQDIKTYVSMLRCGEQQRLQMRQRQDIKTYISMLRSGEQLRLQMRQQQDITTYACSGVANN